MYSNTTRKVIVYPQKFLIAIAVTFIVILIASIAYMATSSGDVRELERHAFRNTSMKYKNPLLTYQLIMDGAGTIQDTLSLFKSSPTVTLKHDLSIFKDHVVNGRITHVLIQGHPYSIKYKTETRLLMYFTIKNECQTFPFPECPSAESIDRAYTQVIHVLGYRTHG